MEETIFKPGDAVYHLSDPKLVMAVESVSDRGVFCNWIHPKTYDRKDGTFSPTSLRIKQPPSFRVSALGGTP